MSYTYTTYKTALQTMVASTPPDADFDTILPSCVDYAEQRIYRKLNLLQTQQGDVSVTTVPGTRTLTVPSSFVVVNSANYFTPAASTISTGTRVALVPMSLEALNMLYPSAAFLGAPSVYAMQDQYTMVLGASPDGAYLVELIGTYRPTPLSDANQSTFLSANLPDLFFAASMVFMSGYMRNFGSQASDPQQGMSWEQQYNTLEGSAMLEEERKRYWSSSWSAYPPSGSAGSPRG